MRDASNDATAAHAGGLPSEVKAGREQLVIHPNLMTVLSAEGHQGPDYRVASRTDFL